MLPELKRYLIEKKWSYKLEHGAKGTQVLVKTCPFCGKDKHKFAVHADLGLFRCWSCGSTGNLYKLKRGLGDVKELTSATSMSDGERQQQGGKQVPMEDVETMHQRLLKSPRALAYCEGRGFGLDIVKRFKLGFSKTTNGERWLAIPHLADGVCWNVKYRSLPPSEKKFRRSPGGKSILFNSDALSHHSEIIVAEAELDALSWIAAGVENVVGVTCGADAFQPDWYDALQDTQKVILALDTDLVGQQGARKLARRIGFDKAWNLVLPDHDANDVLMKHGPQALKESLEYAERFEVAGVVSASDVMLEAYGEAVVGASGLYSPWANVNRILGKRGIQPGEIIVLSARVKTGKTSYANQWAWHAAEQQGWPSLVYCLEMKPFRLAQKTAALIRHTDVELLAPLDYTMARYRLRHVPLYYWGRDAREEMKVDLVTDRMRDAIKRYGLRFWVFDNVHFLCRSLKYVTTEIGQVMRSFKLLADETDTIGCVIAQPKKIESDRVMTMDDLKDSSSIPADADWINLLHRQKRKVSVDNGELDAQEGEDVLSPTTLVRFDGARYAGGGESWLNYDGAAARFDEMEAPPKQSREPRKPRSSF